VSRARLLALLLLVACGGGSAPTASPPVAPPTTPPTTPPAPSPVTYVPGQSYFGRNNYIEYIAGNAPVILTAPHGGALTPGSIPDRTASACGGTATTVTDANTADLVRVMQRRFFALHGTTDSRWKPRAATQKPPLR
jgi:hypothetical protein